MMVSLRRRSSPVGNRAVRTYIQSGNVVFESDGAVPQTSRR